MPAKLKLDPGADFVAGKPRWSALGESTEEESKMEEERDPMDG